MDTPDTTAPWDRPPLRSVRPAGEDPDPGEASLGDVAQEAGGLLDAAMSAMLERVETMLESYGPEQYSAAGAEAGTALREAAAAVYLFHAAIQRATVAMHRIGERP